MVTYEDRFFERFFDIDDLKEIINKRQTSKEELQNKSISELIKEAEVFLDDSVTPEDYVKLNLSDNVSTKSKDEIIYFHLNNWYAGENYPNAEPFLTWIRGDGLSLLNTDKFAKENKICVVVYPVDMSISYNITAPKKWVEENCPELLTKYKKFIVEENEDGFRYGPYTENEFLEYTEENIGLHQQDPHGGVFGEDDDEEENDESED